MKLLTQDEAKEHLAKMNVLTDLTELTELQAIGAIELLDDLQFSFYMMARKAEDPERLKSEAVRLRDSMYELAKEHDVCTCCYQPGHVCRCGSEHDDWWNDEDKWTSQDDINCWLD